jgi:hypothetical protein
VLAIVSSDRRPRASTVIARTSWPKSKPGDFIAMKSARNLELDALAIEDFQSLPLKS